MTQKHTPGPWRYVGKSRIKSDERPIANVFASGITHFERAANARLIAAAPDMLEALKLASDLFDNELVDFDQYGLTCDQDIGDIYRAAIAKAEGTDQ